jgi:hypothetical protein
VNYSIDESRPALQKIFPARDGFSVSFPHIWMRGDFASLDAEDATASLNV